MDAISVEIECDGETVVDQLFAAYFLFHDRYNFFLFDLLWRDGSWLLLLLLFFCSFLLLYFWLYEFLLTTIFLFLRRLLRPLMLEDADLSFSTVSFQEMRTDVYFVLIVFLFQVHVSVIIFASGTELALSHLIQFAGLCSFFEGFSQLSLVMGESAGESLFTLQTVRAHFSPIELLFVSFDDFFAFVYFGML